MNANDDTVHSANEQSKVATSMIEKKENQQKKLWISLFNSIDLHTESGLQCQQNNSTGVQKNGKRHFLLAFFSFLSP